MQSLCHHEVQGEGIFESVNTLVNEAAAGLDALAYARTLCQHYLDNSAEVDDRIRAVLQRWDLDRVASVERNVARVATVELLRNEVPPKVVLNEAVEIAREFGTAESPRFVNGVLDAVWKNLGKET